MDRLNFFREVIPQVMQYYVDHQDSFGEVRTSLIISEDRNHFLLIGDGWQGSIRAYGVLAHAELLNGKIYIQRDGTEEGITDDLLRAGVDTQEIVLAFHHPKVRKHTGLAIA